MVRRKNAQLSDKNLSVARAGETLTQRQPLIHHEKKQRRSVSPKYVRDVTHQSDAWAMNLSFFLSLYRVSSFLCSTSEFEAILGATSSLEAKPHGQYSDIQPGETDIWFYFRRPAALSFLF
jgi:hypothetical protein